MSPTASNQAAAAPGPAMSRPGPLRRPMVEFHAVGKSYGAVEAVKSVSFSIEAGSLVTLLGPSGCGKTTTLRLIAGLELPSAGRIVIDGADVSTMSAAERDVSMVFQSYALFPHMTVLENVCYGLRAGGVSRRDSQARAAEKLAVVGLSGFENRLPSELSGGQQQRVAVARAIVLEPKVLLFDEPLSNLDAKLRRRVRDDIRELQQSLGLTVAYVTHDQEEALAVSDRVIVMQGGAIVQDGTPRDLYERPVSPFVADFIGNANLLPVHAEADGEGRALVTLGALSFHLPSQGQAVGEVLLALRPQALRLVADGADGPGLRGTIRKAAYLGSHMEYQVALDGVSGEIFVVDPHVSHPRAPGTPVLLAIDLSGAALVPPNWDQ